MLTEREKEIARELGIPVDKVDPFLSRIREEQEAAAYLLPQFTGCSRYTERKELAKKVNGNIPLFTTPLAAPDCSELVEALERCHHWLQGSEPHRAKYIGEVLANHDKRMKGEE